jgi:hypothetical protein
LNKVAVSQPQPYLNDQCSGSGKLHVGFSGPYPTVQIYFPVSFTSGLF